MCGIEGQGISAEERITGLEYHEKWVLAGSYLGLGNKIRVNSWAGNKLNLEQIYE